MAEKEPVAGPAFGALLRRHRLEAGLSQEDLAEQARMSANGIGALERGDRQYPYGETVMLLAKALGLTPAAAAELEAAATAAWARARSNGYWGTEHTTNLRQPGPVDSARHEPRLPDNSGDDRLELRPAR